MTDRDRFLDLCAAAAAGSITPEEQRELDTLLATGDAEMLAQMFELQEAAVLLASAAPPAAPPAGLKERVFAEIDGDAAAAPPSRRGRLVAISGWVAAAVLAIAAVAGWDLVAKLRGELDDRITSAAGFQPQETAPQELRASFVRYESGRTVVVVENYKPPAGKDYELWVIRGGAPVSLGVVAADDAGRATVRLDSLEEGDAALAFSLEEKGGSRPGAGPAVVISVAPLS